MQTRPYSSYGNHTSHIECTKDHYNGDGSENELKLLATSDSTGGHRRTVSLGGKLRLEGIPFLYDHLLMNSPTPFSCFPLKRFVHSLLSLTTPKTQIMERKT